MNNEISDLPLTHLKLLLRVVLTDPTDMVPEEMQQPPEFWVEHITDESALTDNWRVLPAKVFGQSHRGTWNPCPLYDHLRGLCDQGHSWSWVVEKRIDWMLLKHYYYLEKQDKSWDIDLGNYE